MVAAVPFRWWRSSLGSTRPGSGNTEQAKYLAEQVERAAARLPIRTKCLARAVALSWMLRRRQNAHNLVIAIRPSEMRESPDALHAWVEVEGRRVIGDLPGPWAEVVRLGS